MVNGTLFPLAENITSENFQQVFVYANSVTNGWSGMLVVIALWLTLFFGWSNRSRNSAAVYASTISLIISLLANALSGWVPLSFVTVNILVLFLFLVFKPLPAANKE